MSEIGDSYRGHIADKICYINVDVENRAHGDQVMRRGGGDTDQRETSHLVGQAALGCTLFFRSAGAHVLRSAIPLIGLAVREVVNPVDEVNRTLLHFDKYASKVLSQYPQADQLDTAQKQNHNHQGSIAG